jgi:integrase
MGEVWALYLAERKPHWSALHYRDHEKMGQAGGAERKRSKGVMTVAGPLAHFMGMKLADVDGDSVQAWAEKEGKVRPTRTRLALRILKAFLRWAAAETQYKGLADASAASGKKTREMAGTSKPKNDYIQREQLSVWFAHVRQIQNPTIAAYLQCLLLTGARREELAELKWADVNLQWRGLTMKDKIEDVRPVPLTPYVAQLLTTLPRRNEWVFSSPTSASGRLTEPSIAHRAACAAAGLQVTLHGLRRSFASLCEWLDIPGGISAQIQGHAPQGVREQNYIRRPLDLLRLHHEKIEAWILEQAGIGFDAKAAPGALRVVA